MPEGHTIHRHARRHRQALAGQRIAVRSPQGRFSSGAERLDGRRLETVEAHGKHLYYRWEGGDTLHVHLGLFGKFRLHRADPPPPSPNTRLVMAGGDVALYLSGPTICELIDPVSEQSLHARLGPDPLRNHSSDDTAARFATNLSRRRIPVGAALLDQRVVAGIGNVYRSEVLFLTGIDPHTPVNELSADEVQRLWEESVRQLRAGAKAGRIVTVDPAEVGAKHRRDLSRHERLYVYKRHGESCRRCGTAISVAEMASRNLWWCAGCQPGTGS